MPRSKLATLLIPYPPLLWRILITTVVLWMAFHIALVVIRIVVPEPAVSAFVVAVCTAAVWLDLARSEHLFFANLGVSPRWSACVALAAAGALEVAFQLVLRVGMGLP